MEKQERLISDYSNDAMIKDSLVPLVNKYLSSIPEYADFYATGLIVALQVIEDGKEIDYKEDRMRPLEAGAFAHFMSRYGFFIQNDNGSIDTEHYSYEMSERGRKLKKCGSIQAFLQKEIADEDHDRWVKETTSQALQIQLANATFQKKYGNIIPIASAIIALFSVGVTSYMSLSIKPKLEQATKDIINLEKKLSEQNKNNKVSYTSTHKIQPTKILDTSKRIKSPLRVIGCRYPYVVPLTLHMY